MENKRQELLARISELRDKVKACEDAYMKAHQAYYFQHITDNTTIDEMHRATQDGLVARYDLQDAERELAALDAADKTGLVEDDTRWVETRMTGGARHYTLWDDDVEYANISTWDDNRKERTVIAVVYANGDDHTSYIPYDAPDGEYERELARIKRVAIERYQEEAQ